MRQGNTRVFGLTTCRQRLSPPVSLTLSTNRGFHVHRHDTSKPRYAHVETTVTEIRFAPPRALSPVGSALSDLPSVCISSVHICPACLPPLYIDTEGLRIGPTKWVRLTRNRTNLGLLGIISVYYIDSARQNLLKNNLQAKMY